MPRMLCSTSEWSADPETMIPCSVDSATHVIGESCPKRIDLKANTAFLRRVFHSEVFLAKMSSVDTDASAELMSHNTKVQSREPVTSVRPSLPSARHVTTSRCSVACRAGTSASLSLSLSLSRFLEEYLCKLFAGGELIANNGVVPVVALEQEPPVGRAGKASRQRVIGIGRVAHRDSLLRSVVVCLVRRESSKLQLTLVCVTLFPVVCRAQR